jgi:cysteine synthase B
MTAVASVSAQPLPAADLGLLEQVGRTPLLRLTRVAQGLAPGVEVYAKAEWRNPSGSIKDRPAASILDTALQTGRLQPGGWLLDSTSGNMGIAYATLAPRVGVRVHLVVPANAGRIRLDLLRSLGAELTLSDPLEGSDGARRAAAELAAAAPDRIFYADQYANPANWQAHYQSTGPEIVQGTRARITHLVAGLGTTGSLVGTGRWLKEHVPGVRVIAFQPEGPLHGLEGLKHLPSSHVPEIYDPAVPDQTRLIATEAAYDMARRLARQEGLLVGPSSAAAAVAALSLAGELEAGVVVTLFPDSGLKYLDEPFWEAA